MRVRTGGLLLAATTVATTLIVAPSPAAADNGTTTRTVLDTSISFATTTKPIVTVPVLLSVGESIHVRGRLETTSNVTYNVGMDDIVRCLDASGSQVGIAAVSARNHEGYDQTSYAIPGHLPLYADLLFVAPAGGIYTCGVFGNAYSSDGTGFQLTAVPTNTWLEISDTNQVGSHWWQNPACSSDGTSPTCTYVGAGSNSTFVFYTDGTPAYRWTANAGATSVSAQANLEVTTCYQNTASCSGVAAYENPRGTNATFDVRMDVIQLDTTLHTCVLTTTTIRTVTASDQAHHHVTYLSLPSVPISSTCGTREFIMRVYVQYDPGNPIKIDGVQGTSSLTNGLMLNMF